MSDYVVVVTDAVRARIFSIEPAAVPEIESGPNLTERVCLVNPEKNLPESAVFADGKSGRNRAPHGGSSHGYDDHRAQHEQEFAKRFARKVATDAQGLIRACHAKSLVIVAEPHMLGFLRREVEGVTRSGVEVRECARNLTKAAAIELQERLSADGHVPARRKPGV